MRAKRLQRLIASGALASLLAVPVADVASATNPIVTVLAIASADGEAVIRVDDGAAAVQRVGDELADGRFELRKVLTDRVVLEERPRDGHPVREVWVYVADEDGRSRVRRIERTIVQPPLPVIPVEGPVATDGARE